MIAAVADTHAAVWHLFADPRLSAKARRTIEDAAATGCYIAISTISLIEVVYLIEKKRLGAQVLSRLADSVESPATVFTEAPIDSRIVEHLRRVPRDQVPDLPDRVIAATALLLGVPVISRDAKIRSQNLRTIW